MKTIPLLLRAATVGDVDTVVAELHDGTIDHILCSQALELAAENGHTALVRALLEDGRADPAAVNSKALWRAAKNGHTAVVRALLEDGRADPAALNSDALWHAAYKGHTEVVRALLNDGRVDPAALNNAALWRAAENGHTAIVRALLEDGRAHPTAFNSKALWRAVENGQTEVVRALLEDGRADPTAFNSKALWSASENGQTAVVRALLNDGRVDPAALNSGALRWAAYKGHTEVVRALLEDGRADPATLNSEALWRAAKNGHTEVVRALLEDGRADPAALNSEALWRAAENGHIAVVRLLLAAMPADARAAMMQLLQAARVGAVRAFLSAYNTDPAYPRSINYLSTLLNMRLTFLSADALFALADALIYRNVNDRQMRDLREQGQLLSGLQQLFGPNPSISSLPVIADAGRALAPFAAVSKDLALRHGQIELPHELLFQIVRLLVPALPPVMAHGIWKMLRTHVQRDFKNTAPASSVERVQRRLVTKVLDQALEGSAQSAVAHYNALYTDTRKLEVHQNTHLATAAQHLKNAMDDLTSALDKGEATIAHAKQQAGSKLATYEEQVKSALGEEPYQKRAHLFETMRSVAQSEVPELAGFAKAYNRTRAQGKSHQQSMAL